MTFLEGLQWAAPLCGVVGFIISPGLTIIYPWLREKLNAELKEHNTKLLEYDIENLSGIDLINHSIRVNKAFRYDWRPKVIRVKRKIKRKLKD